MTPIKGLVVFVVLVLAGCASVQDSKDLSYDEKYCKQMKSLTNANSMFNMDRDGTGPTIGGGGRSEYDDIVDIQCGP